VYVAFVIDAAALRIIGWRAARSMSKLLVLDALKHAFCTRAQEGVTELSGLIAHNDAGSISSQTFGQSWEDVARPMVVAVREGTDGAHLRAQPITTTQEVPRGRDGPPGGPERPRLRRGPPDRRDGAQHGLDEPLARPGLPPGHRECQAGCQRRRQQGREQLHTLEYVRLFRGELVFGQDPGVAELA